MNSLHSTADWSTNDREEILFSDEILKDVFKQQSKKRKNSTEKQKTLDKVDNIEMDDFGLKDSLLQPETHSNDINEINDENDNLEVNLDDYLKS